MTTHVPMARVPFAPLDNPRLQHLASAKNRQNGLSCKSPLSAKANDISFKSTSTPKPAIAKRPLELATHDDFDSENVDPTTTFTSPSKKVKSEFYTFTPVKNTMPPPPLPNRLTTPMKANTSSPRTPLTAPAGRSPKRKIAGMKPRRTSAPFTRIDPPAFTSSLPFSLDAALNGTLGAVPTGATIQETMPSAWSFEIYEDSPEEEAATLMEHSTLTLDLSSDEQKVGAEERGKENCPPEGYEGPGPAAQSLDATGTTTSSVEAAPTKSIVRKKVVKADEMDDGLRSPLSDLETDEFFPEGLGQDSVFMVLPTPEKLAVPIAPVVTAQPVTFTAGSSAKKGLKETKKEEILIFEDDSTPEPSTAVSNEEMSHVKNDGKIDMIDENTAPAA